VQGPATELDLDTPVASAVDTLSCVISNYTSQGNPDACYQAGGRCIPSTRDTRCIPAVHANSGTRYKSWQRYPEAAQACYHCRCVRQSREVGLNPSGENANKAAGPPTPGNEAAVTAARTSAGEENIRGIDCAMTSRPGSHCEEAECRREGGLCLAQPFGRHARCFGHMRRDGELFTLQFKGNILVPSCTNCSCTRLESPLKNAVETLAGKGKLSEELPIYSNQLRPSLQHSFAASKEFASFPNHAAEKMTGKRKSSEELPTSSDEFLPSFEQLLSTPNNAAQSFSGKRKFSEALPTSSDEFLPSFEELLSPPNNAATSLGWKRKFSEEHPTSSDEFLPSFEQLTSSSEVLSPSREELLHFS
jgi:hypothetical protein